jgi:hypothetical protein
MQYARANTKCERESFFLSVEGCSDAVWQPKARDKEIFPTRERLKNH